MAGYEKKKKREAKRREKKEKVKQKEKKKKRKKKHSVFIPEKPKKVIARSPDSQFYFIFFLGKKEKK
jgi:hypothetical protein